MRQELLTILFIRSSYKIRKINLPFIYYKLIKLLVFLFVLSFLALAIGIVVLKQQNSQLKQMLLRNEKQYQVLHSQPLEYKGQKKVTNDPPAATSTPSTFTPLDSNQVAINDLIVSRPNADNINISFKLANIIKGSPQLQGYLVVGAFPEPIQAEPGVLFPHAVKIDKNFNIENISQGDYFSIKYLKNITITMYAPTASQLKNIMITVCLKNGNIIYRKVEQINEK